MMADMMVPMIRVVSPFILEAYHGQIDVHPLGFAAATATLWHRWAVGEDGGEVRR